MIRTVSYARPSRLARLAPALAACALLIATAVSTPGARAESERVTPAILASDIAPFDVVYEVGNNLITAGLASLTLAKDADTWVYTLATKPTGVFKLTGKGRIREVSVLDMVSSGDLVELQPRSYSYRQDDEDRRSVDATFDRNARTVSWQHRGESGTDTLDRPLLDRLSVTLVVMHLLRRGFDDIELDIFDSGEIKTMRFVNEGVETLETNMGKIATIRVRSENADGGSRSSMTWFAPSLDYVPVRIEQKKRDELVARMNLLKLTNRVKDIDLADPESADQ